MSVIGSIHRHVLLPAFESGLKRRRTFRYWRELERSQWLDGGALEAIQFDRLRCLVAHAYAKSPYYALEWDRLGLHPEALRTRDDFQRWPVIGRETIRANRERMRAMSRLITKSTGGSTGEPLHFDLDPDSNDRRTAAWHRGYGWARAGPGTRQLYLWGVTPGRRAAARAKDRAYHALYRRRIMSCFDLSPGFEDRFLEALERSRAEAIVAYVNPLFEVARRLERAGKTTRFRPGSIVVGAEKLHGFQREVIERVFGAPVFETYGSREFMLIGAECEQHSGLHLTAENLLVEVLDEHGLPAAPGVEGDIVVTDLTNFGMPFIRYLTGDRAVAGFARCPCRRGLPLLRKVVGRRLDMVRGEGGRLIPGEFFPHLVKDFAAIRRFQVVQEGDDGVRFRMVTEGMSALDRARFETLVRDAVGTRVRFEDVADIPLTRAGKLQVVVHRSAA